MALWTLDQTNKQTNKESIEIEKQKRINKIKNKETKLNLP